jgi:hypothetical protein
MRSLIFSLFALIGTASSAVPERDHILLITIDDLNDWIGCLTEKDAPEKDGQLTGQGHPQASTPHMDRLAKRGVSSDNYRFRWRQLELSTDDN